MVVYVIPFLGPTINISYNIYHTNEYVFLGLGPNSKCYILPWFIYTSILHLRDVVFDETLFPFDYHLLFSFFLGHPCDLPSILSSAIILPLLLYHHLFLIHLVLMHFPLFCSYIIFLLYEPPISLLPVSSSSPSLQTNDSQFVPPSSITITWSKSFLVSCTSTALTKYSPYGIKIQICCLIYLYIYHAMSSLKFWPQNTACYQF